MSFDLEMINKRVKEDAEGFALDCERQFNDKVNSAAKMIIERIEKSRVVLLSGPSGSGKTTTAKKICDALETFGIIARSVSMDKYFVTPDPIKAPRTKDGEIDKESPYCLDIALLNSHFEMLERGEEIMIPYFNFKTQTQDLSRSVPFRLDKDEIVVYEGIHALNDMLASSHPDAFKLYISARSDVEHDGDVCFKRTWTRIMRRVVRDELFRGTDVSDTLRMWANVRRGEKKYISPFKSRADLLFDSSMEYEIPVMKRYALKAFSRMPEDMERISELQSLLPVLSLFDEIDPDSVPADSILREFIGGGKYEY